MHIGRTELLRTIDKLGGRVNSPQIMKEFDWHSNKATNRLWHEVDAGNLDKIVLECGRCVDYELTAQGREYLASKEPSYGGRKKTV